MPDPISRAEMIALRSHLEWLDGETKEGVDWSDVSEPLRRCLAHLERTQPTDTQADLTRARDLAGKLWWMAQLPWDKAEPNMTAALQSEREAAAAGWLCFHCSERFIDRDAAREHFGDNCMSDAACQIDIARFREMEELHARHLAEDSDTDRAMYRMQAEHTVALRQEEEAGYARGLRDGREAAAAEARRAALLEAEIACGPETWAGFRIRALVSQEADNG